MLSRSQFAFATGSTPQGRVGEELLHHVTWRNPRIVFAICSDIQVPKGQAAPFARKAGLNVCIQSSIGCSHPIPTWILVTKPIVD
jgi:nitrate/TMAO reductase-like tetraheme cytochrome c subunit